MKIASYLKGFTHILMPKTCCACDCALYAHEEALCIKCLYHLPLTDFHTHKDNESAKQLWGKLDFEFASSMLYLSKSSRVEVLLHRLKFQGYYEIGVFLGKKYATQLQTVYKQDYPLDYIIPIPIHPSKRIKRGYNQAESFAKGLGKGLGIPVLNKVLQRVVASASQTTKDRAERYENVENVFQITKHSSAIKNKHVLLVDDVLTTGATICSAGNILRKAEGRVSVATLVRA